MTGFFRRLWWLLTGRGEEHVFRATVSIDRFGKIHYAFKSDRRDLRKA